MFQFHNNVKFVLIKVQKHFVILEKKNYDKIHHKLFNNKLGKTYYKLRDL